MYKPLPLSRLGPVSEGGASCPASSAQPRTGCGVTSLAVAPAEVGTASRTHSTANCPNSQDPELEAMQEIPTPEGEHLGVPVRESQREVSAYQIVGAYMTKQRNTQPTLRSGDCSRGQAGSVGDHP